ncbi:MULTISPECIES: SOS response-associated peptidase family protein [unclassified Caulobacter]|uniref:SOS response-associated peptidase family protein n=1 Tax=unclassified Caulobacter TaxID=2648921 RepID=UPI0009EA6856|nr:MULTISPECIES: SOS response-associated peptidase family protein [unclassified Caulobacter]
MQAGLPARPGPDSIWQAATEMVARADRRLAQRPSPKPDQDHEKTRQNIWFALDDSRPLAFFAGIWTPHACVRMKSKGWEEIEAYGFLTTESAEPVKTYHSKAMPVILTEPAEWDLWMSDAPWTEVAQLQRPQPEGRLKILARGGKGDDVIPA